jgi:hypothetical protein
MGLVGTLTASAVGFIEQGDSIGWDERRVIQALGLTPCTRPTRARTDPALPGQSLLVRLTVAQLLVPGNANTAQSDLSDPQRGGTLLFPEYTHALGAASALPRWKTYASISFCKGTCVVVKPTRR